MRYKVELEAATQLLAEVSVDAESEEAAEEEALKLARKGQLIWKASDDVEDPYVSNVEATA